MFVKPPWEDFFPDFDDLLPIGKIFDTSISEKIKREVKSVIGNEMKPKVGSVLHCSLLQTVEHTGIYVGWNKVVHLNGDGIIEKVSYAEFIGRLDGMNPTIAICCPVDQDNNPIGDKVVAKRARSFFGQYRDYNLITDNCHKFTYYCLTGTTLPIVMFNDIESALDERYDFCGWEPIDW